MAAEIAASAITAAAQLIGNFASNQINAERAASDMITYLNLVRKQRDWQLEDQQYAKNLMGYEYENFTSPSAQMKSYSNAGLNPWLMSHSDQIGSGQATALPGLGENRGSVSPVQRPPLDNFMNGVADKLYGASQIKNQRIAALSEMAKSIPSLVKGVGSESAKRVLASIFGRDVDTDMINDVVQNEALQTQYQTEVNRIQSVIASKYGEKEASNRVALQEQQFNKMSAEIGLMASEGKLNEQKIHTLMSDYVRNVADAWKLKREGDYFVASAETINALRGLTVASLQNEVTKSGFENRIKGYYEGSGLDNYLNGSHHSQKTGDVLRIQENKTGSELVQAMDLVFGKWLKVSAAP